MRKDTWKNSQCAQKLPLTRRTTYRTFFFNFYSIVTHCSHNNRERYRT